MKITKAKLKQIIKEELSVVLKEHDEDTKAPQAKEVDHGTLEVDGIDASDYPDFADAYFSYGKYTDGTEMTDDELYQLADEDPGLLNDMVQHFIH